MTTVEVHWREGITRYSATVIEARPRRSAPPPQRLDDVPADVLEAVSVHPVADVLDVVAGALEPLASEAVTVAA